MNREKHSSIFFVGMMASGKSTIGWHLAQRLCWPFFDVDKVIEARCGVPVSYIFEKEGEAGFRARETRIVRELTSQKRCIVSMGGGVPMFPVNRPFLQKGLVVALLVSPETVLERTRYDKTRPLLQVADPAQHVRAMLSKREPIYRSVADVLMSTSHLSPHVVVDQLMNLPEVQEVVARANASFVGSCENARKASKEE